MTDRQGAYYVAPALALVLIVFGAPLLMVAYSSVTHDGAVSFTAFSKIFSSRAVWLSLYNTVEIAIVASVLSGLSGYVVALHISERSPRYRAILTAIVMVPFWASILVKAFAFSVILGYSGLVNSVLKAVHAGWNAQLLFNRFGLYVGMVNYLIPFVVLPVLSNLLEQDRNAIRAAELMGATPWQIFRNVTLPLSLPAVGAAFLTTMILSLGMLITPALLGGRQDVMLAQLIDFYTREVLDWQSASILALIVLVPTFVMIQLLLRLRAKGAAL